MVRRPTGVRNFSQTGCGVYQAFYVVGVYQPFCLVDTGLYFRGEKWFVREAVYCLWCPAEECVDLMSPLRRVLP